MKVKKVTDTCVTKKKLVRHHYYSYSFFEKSENIKVKKFFLRLAFYQKVIKV